MRNWRFILQCWKYHLITMCGDEMLENTALFRKSFSAASDRTFVNKFIIRKARLIRWEKITFLIFLTLLHTAVRRGCFWEIGFKGWFWKSEIERRRVLIRFQRLRFWRLDRMPPLVNMYPLFESLKVDRGLNSYFTPRLSDFEIFRLF